MKKNGIFVLCVSVSLLCFAPLASAASVFISLQDSFLNGRIEQLQVVANLPVMRKPYNVVEVRRYAEKIKSKMPGLYTLLDDGLRRYEQTLAITQMHVTVAHGTDTEHGKVLANARGERVSSRYHASGAMQIQPTEWLVASLGGLAMDSPDSVIPVDSYIALGGDNIQIDIGYREHWLSPFQDSAMLLSTNARPSLSVGLTNPVAFENWANLHYEFFVSRLETTNNILFGDQREVGQPALLGTHLSLEPITGWTISLNRTMQFGGGSREVNAGQIWRAFKDPVSKDNYIDGCPSQFANTCEFGNQEASVSSRMNFSGVTPFALYFEYAGEDTASGSNKKLGNLAISAGLFIPFMPEYLLGENWSFSYEFTERQDAWYVHHIYGDGYTNDGIGMGHWGANDRNSADPVGATAQTLKLGWQRGLYDRYEFTFRQIENENYGQFAYKTGHEFSLRYFGTVFGQHWGYQMTRGNNVYGEHFARVALSWEWQ